MGGRRQAEGQVNTGGEETVYGVKGEESESARGCQLRVNVRAVEVNGRRTVADRRAVRDAGDAAVEWRRSRQDSGRETSRPWLDYGRTMRSTGPILRFSAVYLFVCLFVRELFFSS